MSCSTTDALVDVVMPQMGTSMSEGTVLAWPLAVGDEVAADQVVCEISTDKIDSELPAPAAGVLVEILVAPGETVEVGTVLARIAAAGGGGGAAAEAAPPAAPAEADPPARPAAAAANGRGAAPGRYSPVVRRVAAAHGVDLSLVPGTGRGGRVTKKDVTAWIEAAGDGAAPPAERPLHSESPYRPDPQPGAGHAAQAGAGADARATAEPGSWAHPQPSGPAGGGAGPAASPAADLGGVQQPLGRMRQSIGAAMLRSQQQAATCTTVVECDMSQVERRRRELGLTALPLVARAAIDSLREFPDLNATLEGTTLTRYERVHLGIAVSLGDDGLIVPVIHDAQELAPEGLAARIKDLARRARARQLEPHEVQGATFTITNPGQYGALIATPVIPLPQVAILDLEAVVKRPVVVAGPDGGDAIAIRPITHLCMSWDHRALDGAYAAQFLAALRRRLEAA